MQKNILIIIIMAVCFFYQKSFAINEYWLTLRNDKTNLRQGPSFEYPIKIFYKKKHLPIRVIDKSENFRKIQDHENNTGWIHISQLSKKKAAIIKEEKVLVFKNPTIYSKPQVILKKGKLCLITKCKNDWCKIKVDEYSGWVKKENLWGRI